MSNAFSIWYISYVRRKTDKIFPWIRMKSGIKCGEQLLYLLRFSNNECHKGKLISQVIYCRNQSNFEAFYDNKNCHNTLQSQYSEFFLQYFFLKWLSASLPISLLCSLYSYWSISSRVCYMQHNIVQYTFVSITSCYTILLFTNICHLQAVLYCTSNANTKLIFTKYS